MNDKLKQLKAMGAEVEDTIDRLMGDEEMYLSFLAELPDNQNILALRKAVDAGDAETAKNEIHTLKGVAANLGLLPLQDVCMDMLLDFRAGDVPEAMAQIGAVEKEFARWATAIRG